MMLKKQLALINESAKGTSVDIITKIGCHVDSVKRFQKGPAPRKKDQMLLSFQDYHKAGFEEVNFYYSWTSKCSKIYKKQNSSEYSLCEISTKQPPLMPGHENLRVEWASNYRT